MPLHYLYTEFGDRSFRENLNNRGFDEFAPIRTAVRPPRQMQNRYAAKKRVSLQSLSIRIRPINGLPPSRQSSMALRRLNPHPARSRQNPGNQTRQQITIKRRPFPNR
jgi:hypothetical protein